MSLRHQTTMPLDPKTRQIASLSKRQVQQKYQENTHLADFRSHRVLIQLQVSIGVRHRHGPALPRRLPLQLASMERRMRRRHARRIWKVGDDGPTAASRAPLGVSFGDDAVLGGTVGDSGRPANVPVAQRRAKIGGRHRGMALTCFGNCHRWKSVAVSTVANGRFYSGCTVDGGSSLD